MERMAYLSDIFCYLNEVNLAMQGTNVTCFKVKDKINALQGKLKLWGECIAEGDVECFENLYYGQIQFSLIKI